MLRKTLIVFLQILIFSSNSAMAQFEDNPLSQAVDNTKYDFASDQPGFVPQTQVSNFGGDAVASQKIGNDEVAIMAVEFQDTFGSGGNVIFDWKVSSEAGYDFLIFIVVDQNEQIVEERKISGEKDWATISIPIPSGNHTLAWGYSKDLVSSRGLDTAYVDRVRITKNGEELDEACRTGKTALNSALDNDELNFTDFSGSTNPSRISFLCETSVFNVGGSSAVSEAIENDTAQLWTNVNGPLDILFDWSIEGGLDNFFRVEVWQDRQRLERNGKDYFGEIIGARDWETFHLRVPRGEHRIRWVYFNRSPSGNGLLDNVRVLPPSVDPKVMGVLPNIFKLLVE